MDWTRNNHGVMLKRQIEKALKALWIAAVATIVLPLAACSGIEWVDLIRVNDVTYYSDLRSDNVTESSLSPYARTTHKLSGNVRNRSYKIRNGDAAFLEPGTTVYSIAGHDPALQVAAKREGKWYIYEASK
jgi:hypothetical protein